MKGPRLELRSYSGYPPPDSTMASSTASIPRFLLPQSGLIWRRAAPPSPATAASRRILTRLASGSTTKPNPPTGPRVLAKPERFNPPSHGARLPKKTLPRHYGGDLSAEEAAAQAQREYPFTAPSPSTRAHWFLNNRWIHVAITVGTLSGLAVFTFVLSFTRTSPFADMLPPASDFLWHPITATRVLIEVLRLHEAHKSARINEKRRRNVEDVAKRAAYRRAHGLPEEVGLFNTPMAKIQLEDEKEEVGGVGAEQQQQQGEGEVMVESTDASGSAEAPRSERDKGRRLTEEERQAVVKEAKAKWLGVF